jgi:hypothetical protein
MKRLCFFLHVVIASFVLALVPVGRGQESIRKRIPRSLPRRNEVAWIAYSVMKATFL